MALSGSVTTTASHNRSLKFSWTATQDNVTNKSTISWTLKGSGSASGYVKVHAVRVTIDGVVVYNNSDVNCECYSGTTVTSGTRQITHNSDGTRTFKVKVEAGIYNSAINCSGSSTFTLNTIILGSTITSASNITLGSACQIRWTPNSASYYYKLKYALGNWSYTTALLHPNQTTEYTYNGYVVPIDGVAQQMPSSKTDTMTAYLYTYSDSTASKQVGATSSKAFTVTMPNDSNTRPALSGVTFSLDNSSNSVVQGWGIALTGFTKIAVHAEANAKYGASISSFALAGSYSDAIISSSPLNYTTEILSSSGNKNFTVKANDSRGFTSQAQSSSPFYFYPYVEPDITSFNVSRKYSNASEGRTTLSVRGSWNYDTVDNHNSVTVVLKYKTTSSTTWITYGSIPNGTEFDIEYPSGGSSQVGFSEVIAYNFRLEVTDAIGSKSVSDIFVPTGDVLLNFRFGGKGLGVGRIAESDRLEVGLETEFMNTTSFSGNVRLIINGVEVNLEDYIYDLIVSAHTPQITTQPTGGTYSLGETIPVSLVAKGIGLTYQWYYKKVGQNEYSEWAGHTSSSESGVPDSSWDGMQIYCEVKSAVGNTTRSEIITITIE